MYINKNWKIGKVHIWAITDVNAIIDVIDVNEVIDKKKGIVIIFR